jgi:type IV pilus assembly protein PilA
MFGLEKKVKNKKGFTLIELILVLAVLAIIMAIAVPKFIGVQENAERDADRNSINLIAKAAELAYIQDPNGDLKGKESSVSANELVELGYLDSIKLNDTEKFGASDGSALTVTYSEDKGVKITTSSRTEVYPDFKLEYD